MINEIVQFSFPTNIYFGPGAVRGVKDYLMQSGYKRPLVVTDRVLYELREFSDFTGLLSSGLDYRVFSGVHGNPVKSQVIKGMESYREHRADSIIGFGGGAALDVAKAIAVLASHPGDLFEYEEGRGRKLGSVPYWIAIPTTSGTGSEVGRSAVISDDSSKLKKIIFSPKLMAQAVFADPLLTLTLPASVTAATGMDALTHCIEAFLAKGFHPLCDGIALEGIRLAALNLAKCVHEPKNKEARGHMMMSSMMGAVAFQKGLGLVHSCAHALSTVSDMHHGLANGIMLPFGLSFNLAVSKERFGRIAQTVGLRENSGEAVLEWLRTLREEIGIPAGLKLKVKSDCLSQLVDCAANDPCHQLNPREVKGDDFRRIFIEALEC